MATRDEASIRQIIDAIVTTCNKLQRKSPRLIISNPETALNDDDL